jgi:truncated hemoglobin YjbI
MTLYPQVKYSATASIVLAYLEMAAHSMVNSPF